MRRGVDGNGWREMREKEKKSVNIFDKKLIIFPLNLENTHWSLLAITNPRNYLTDNESISLFYMDSIAIEREDPYKLKEIVSEWFKYMKKSNEQQSNKVEDNTNDTDFKMHQISGKVICRKMLKTKLYIDYSNIYVFSS